MSAKKDMRKAIAACEAAGLRYEPQHTHPRVVQPATGRFVSFSNTPTCQHAYKHLLRDVKKYLGLTVTL
jgi:hypothetical protein